jgi:Lrp/AsnC family transcriptional regulator for asnA, asnC and gidA
MCARASSDSGRLPQSDVLQRAVGLSPEDRELIQSLQADGRAPYAQLARELRRPEKAVRARVQELIDDGVIDITTVASPEVLGYGVVAMVGVTVRDRRPTEVADDLATIDLVDYVVVTTGRFDLFVEVYCHSLVHLREVVEGQIRSRNGVWGVEVMPYLKLYYQQRAGLNRRFDLEEPVDSELMAALSTDGRMPLRAVAQRVGVSETQVRRRLSRLRDSGALRIQAITNPMSLGFDTMAFAGISVRPGHPVQGVADGLAGIPQVTYVAVCAARFEILVELACLDAQELAAVVDSGVRGVDGVDKVELFLYLRLEYKRILPASVLERARLSVVGEAGATAR